MLMLNQTSSLVTGGASGIGEATARLLAQQGAHVVIADVNEPARVLSDHQNFYYALLSLANEKEQPGAELNAAWYQRNAKIFAKLTQIAQPGDRGPDRGGQDHARHEAQSFAINVGVVVPHPAHRRQAIADVQRAWMGHHAFAER